MNLKLLLLLILLYGLFTRETRAQVISEYLIKGADWRICGSHEGKDTLRFVSAQAKGGKLTCYQTTYTQLMTYPGNQFRFLNWNNGSCTINEPGSFEANDATGIIRFYFEDGHTRDYLMIFLNKEKLTLIDVSK